MFKDLTNAVKGFGGSPDQIMNYAKGVKFPTTKQELLKAFESNNAPKEITAALNKLPDKTYNSPQDLISGLKDMLGK